VLLVCRDAGRVRGSVLLNRHTSENGSHRAEVAKLLVHRSVRREGRGEALVRAAEAEARRLGLTLLLLDTQSRSAAERLYRRLGWEEFGRVDGYAYTPDGVLDATTFMCRRL
jgi:GNAT superfamily N-acetyltransferase